MLEQKFSEVKTNTQLHSCVVARVLCECFCVFAAQLQLERDELRKAFTESVEKAQHNGDIENMVLEKKLQALTESLEETEAQLSAVLSASNMDQTALSSVIKKTEVVLYIYLMFLLQQSSKPLH